MKSYQEQIIESVNKELADNDKFRSALMDCFTIIRLENEIRHEIKFHYEMAEKKQEIEKILSKYNISL